MSAKPVVLREQAQNDINDAIDHYLTEASPAVAFSFIDALEDALCETGMRPKRGSPRYAHELDIPGLRFRTIGRFPYLIFYIEKEAEVDVWRILHGARDVPAKMFESS